MRKEVQHSDDTLLALSFPDEVSQLREYLSGPPGAVFVTSEQGTGLSTLLKLLIRESGMSMIRLASSQTRLKGVLKDTCATSVGVDFKRKCILLDEFDVMMGDSTQAQDLVTFLLGSPNVHIVCAGHPVRKTKLFTSLCKPPSAWVSPPIAFPSPPIDRIREVLLRHGIVLGKDGDTDNKNVDLRSMLLTADMGLFHKRDIFQEGVQALTTCLEAPTLDKSLRVFAFDSSVIPALIQENYLTLVDDLRTIAEVSDSISAGDTLEKFMYKHQRFDAINMYASFSVAYPASRLPTPITSTTTQAKKPTQGKQAIPSSAKYGTVWSKMHNLATKSKLAKHVATHMISKGSTASHVEDYSFVRSILRPMIETEDFAGIRSTLLSNDPEILLSICRLWKSPWYGQPVHLKMKKGLERSASGPSASKLAE